MTTCKSLLNSTIAIAVLASVSGCAYAPSNTNWRETPKVVMQVCVPSEPVITAEIAYYRPSNLGVATISFVAKTELGQNIFEGTYEDPSPAQTAFVVRLLPISGVVTSLHFVYLLRERTSEVWSPWRVPDTVAPSFPSEIDKFRRFEPVDKDLLKHAPRIRVRAEMLNHHDRTKLSGERYVLIKGCN